MKFYFVRHGESEANVLHIISNRGQSHGLTSRGRRQVTELAAGLAHADVTRIYTSPLLRAVQTAEILSGALGPEVETTAALSEFDCGLAEGRSDPAAWELHHKVVEDWLQRGRLDARIEGGESFLEMRARFVPFIERLVVGNDDAPAIILVGHGGLYYCLLPLILVNVDAAAQRPFPNAGYVLAQPGPAGLVCLEWCGRPLESVIS